MFDFSEKEMEDYLEKNIETIIEVLEEAIEETDYFEESCTGDNGQVSIEYVGRQLNLAGSRPDMIFKGHVGSYHGEVEVVEKFVVVAELKKHAADLNALSQVVGYAASIDGCIPEKVFTCIISPGFAKNLSSFEMLFEEVLLVNIKKVFIPSSSTYSMNDDYLDRCLESELIKKLR